jgi:hypothetical protein
MTSQTLPTLAPSDRLLRTTLRLDGIFTLGSAALSAVFAPAVAQLTGLGVEFVVTVALSMIAFGGFLLWAASQTPMVKLHAWMVMAAYDLWILGSKPCHNTSYSPRTARAITSWPKRHAG